jgi:hypothetical protein
MRKLVALISCLVLSTPALARNVLPAEQRDPRYFAYLPGCEDPSVLSDISTLFGRQERRFWASMTIVGFADIGEVAWRPWGLDYIPRRFCSGWVLTSDGYRRRIYFSVREGLGFIGYNWATEWCIDGLDRYYAFAPHCKQALP